MSPELVLDVDDAMLQVEKLAAEVAIAAEGKSPAVDRRFDVDDALSLDAWLAEKVAAEVAVAAERMSPFGGYRLDVDDSVLEAWIAKKEQRNAQAVEAQERESVHFGFTTDSGDCLPPYDPYVNYLSPRPRFLFYDPKRAERLWRELDRVTLLEFNGSSSSLSGDSISEQSVDDDDDDDCLQPIQEEKHLEKGAERSSFEQFGLKMAAERKSPESDRPLDADEDMLAAWLAEKHELNAPAFEIPLPESAHLASPTGSIGDGGGYLPPYDPDVNYLSPRPRFLFYDPKRAERLRRELDSETFLEFNGSSSSLSGDSISEQCSDDDDYDSLQSIEDEEKGAGWSSTEQFVVKSAAEVAVAGGGEVAEKNGKNTPESAQLDFPADSVDDNGGCLPPYDPYVNYLSPRPRFLFYDPKRAERLRRELDSVTFLEFNGSSSSLYGDSMSEQSRNDDDDDDDNDEHSQSIQEDEVVERGAERSSAEQFGVKKDEKRAWCGPSLVFKYLLFLSLMILSLFGASSIYSSSNVAYDHGGSELVLTIHIPLPIPSSFSFYKLMSSSFWLPNRPMSMTNDGDDAYTIARPKISFQQLNASFNFKDLEMGTGLLEDDIFAWKSDPSFLRKYSFGVKSDVSLVRSLDMDERLITSHVTVGRNVEELLAGRNIDADELIDIKPDNKQDSEVFEKDIFCVHSDPSLINNVAVKDTLAEKCNLGFTRSADMEEKLLALHVTTGENVEDRLLVEIFGADELGIDLDKKQVSEVFPFHVEHPMSGKLSSSQTVSLSLEPMCNTYGIISRNALIRNRLLSRPTARRNNSFFSYFLDVFQNNYFGT